MRKFIIIAIWYLLFTVVISCNKHLDINSSRIQNDEGSWNSFEDARAGLIGAYALTRAALAADNGHWMYGELRMGEFESTSRLDLKAVIDNKLTAEFPLLKRLSNWNRFYAAINACNLFIERSVDCKQDARYVDKYYNLDLAQVRALRAYLYFYISRIWGDVPLIIVSDDGKDFVPAKRTKQAIVLEFVENELLGIKTKLPYSYIDGELSAPYISNYYSLSGAEWNGTLITSIDVSALLVHVLVWQGRYAEANGYLSILLKYFSLNEPIIKANQLPLELGIANNFSGANTDLKIGAFFGFQFLQEQGEYTSDGHIESLTLANTSSYYMSKMKPDIYVPKSKIVDLFASNQHDIYDLRFGIDTTNPFNHKYSTVYFENLNTEVPIFKKIRFVDGNKSSGKYPKFNSSLVFSRVVEIYLLAAEVSYAIGNYDESLEQLRYVRKYRALRNIVLPEFNRRQVLLKEVFNERKKELMGEAWSWYDLIRYKKLDGNDVQFNNLINTGGIYWPVDQAIILVNPDIEQLNYWR